MQLNIGASQTRLEGFTNIDIAPWADVRLDVGREPLPFEDSSVDLVFSYHTLEHVPDYLYAIGEIHRVLKHGAPFLVGLPYISLTEFHLVNPYHHHGFNEFSFNFFERGKLAGSASEGALRPPTLFKQAFRRLHYMGFANLLPETQKRWARRHLFNVVRKIDFGVVAVKEPGPVEFDAKTMEQDFLRILRARTPYVERPKPVPKSRRDAELQRFKTWWWGKED